MDNVRRWVERAHVTHERAAKRYTKRWTVAKADGETLYRDLNRRIWALEERRDLLPQERRAQVKNLTDTAKREIEGLDERVERVERARHESNAAYSSRNATASSSASCCVRWRILPPAREMRELDNGMEQIMTSMKVALVNLVMHTRDRYFGADDRHATWCPLAPFFRLSGRIAWGANAVSVELRPFNDRQLNRDLAALCGKVGELRPRLPDGASSPSR